MHLYYLYSGWVWSSGPHPLMYVTSPLLPIVDIAGLLVILGAVVYFRTYKPTNTPVVVARGKLIILVGFAIEITAILVHVFGLVAAFSYPEAALQTADDIARLMMGDATSLGIAIVAVGTTAIGILVGGVHKGVKLKVP